MLKNVFGALLSAGALSLSIGGLVLSFVHRQEFPFWVKRNLGGRGTLSSDLLLIMMCFVVLYSTFALIYFVSSLWTGNKDE